jgi:hypothetical protein
VDIDRPARQHPPGADHPTGADHPAAVEYRADAEHRVWLRQLLDRAAAQGNVTVDGQPVFGWRDRSIGVKVRTNGDAGGGSVWLRVVAEREEWAGGLFWTGNVEANVISGVGKPVVLGHEDWSLGAVRARVEWMSLAPGAPCSPTPELASPVALPDAWWVGLRASLRALAATGTSRVAVAGDEVTRRLAVFFGDRVQIGRVGQIAYGAAHADLHWANLMQPECVLVDWEGWGLAPVGYDAALLLAHSLLVPQVAARVRAELAEFLDTPAGGVAQLVATARLLLRIEGGDYPQLAVPLHHHAERVIARLAAGRR